MRVKHLLISLLLGLGTALVVTVIFAAGPLPRARAANIIVDSALDDESDGCMVTSCTLREAIADASPGDTITFNLTYPATITLTSGQLTIDKELTIDGPGVDRLSISGANTYRVFSVTTSSAVTITEVTVRDGYVAGGKGGGIWNAGTLHLNSVRVISNTARGVPSYGQGGGIYIYAGHLTLNGGQVASNTAEYGGGVYIFSSDAKLDIDGGYIVGNYTDPAVGWSGGGVYIYQGEMRLSAGQISDNSAAGPGGGLYVYQGKATMSSGQIGSNFAGVEGGGVYVNSGIFTQTGGTIFENYSNSMGGGIFVAFGSTTLSGGQVLSNTARNYGGGVYVGSVGAMLKVEGGQILSNTANDGGGVFIESGHAALTSGEIISNSASSEGGGIYVYLAAAAFTQTNSSTIAYNTAQTGGGVFIDEGNAVVNGGQILGNTANDGGGVYISQGNVVLNGGQILSNTANRAGGVYVGYDSSPATFTQTGDSIIGYNTANYDGGGLLVNSGTVALVSGQIVSNTANGSGIQNGGGGVYVYAGNVTLSGGQIISNTAFSGGGMYLNSASTTLASGEIRGNFAQDGGGMYIREGSAMLSSGQIISNTAGATGGGMYLESGETTLNGGEIRGNTANYAGGVFVGSDFGTATFTQTGSSIIAYNTAGTDGGGMLIWQGNATLSGGQIIGNVAGADGGGVLVWRGSATLSGGQILSNTASNGGGVYVGFNSGTAIFTQTNNSLIAYNTASQGGGIHVDDGITALNGGQIANNTASEGGGIYVSAGDVTLNGTEVHGNTSTGSWPGGGGGVYVDIGSLEITGGQVVSNTALYGGGVHIYDGSVTLSAGEIRGNAADIGGGGVMIVSSNAAFTQTGTSIISDNSAIDGGGVHVRNGSALLSGGQIISNTATSGGGVYVYEGSTAVDGTEVRGNTATGSWPEEGGGGFYVRTGSLVLNSGHIADNTTPYGTNALHNYSGAITTTAALTVVGDISQANGMFNGDSGPLVAQGSLVLAGGTFIAPTDGFQLTDSFDHTGGTYQQTQNVTGTADIGFPKTGGVIINANDQDLDSTTVVIQADTDCTSTPGETVRRCYNITPTNTSNVSATITFYFYDTEVISANSCGTLNVYRWNGSSWITLTLDTNYGTGGRDCSGNPQSIRVKDVSEFSPFVLKSGGAPTAVTLASFTAEPQAGGILTTWETVIEIDNVGFNLYRSTSPTGSYVKLNETLVPSQAPGSVFGATYTWLDEDVEADTTYYYKLEDIQVGGKRTFHGPVAARPAEPTALVLRRFGIRGSLAAALLALLGTCGLVSVWWVRKRR